MPLMKFHVLTLFPEAFGAPLRFSIVGRAVGRGLAAVEVTDLRGFTRDAHGTADDYQFGGGHGMVMKPEPVFEAADAALSGYDSAERDRIPVILFTPQGELLTQSLVEELAGAPAIVLVCGHYAGVDERVAEGLATRQVSVGDYVLTGGELPAMLVIDAVTRLLPGVAGPSHAGDSITTGLLQHPLYTRPAEYRGMAAPAVLLSGHHGEIARWRRRRSLERTWARRPDLLATADLTADDRAYLAQLAESADPLCGLIRRNCRNLILAPMTGLIRRNCRNPPILPPMIGLIRRICRNPPILPPMIGLIRRNWRNPLILPPMTGLIRRNWRNPPILPPMTWAYPAQLAESAPDNLGRRDNSDDLDPGGGKGIDGDGGG